MIEINLVPDIKQELIRAQTMRSTVVSISILAGLGAIAGVVVLCLWVFAGQTVAMKLSDDSIRDSNAKISKIPDLSNALTVQNQLTTLSELNANKNIDSRLFGLLDTINPPAPNDVQVSVATVDAETKTITIEAQAVGGFAALETYRKTINATKITYTMTEGEEKAAKEDSLASNLADIERSFGENAEGAKVLRFTLVFTYADNLFSPQATQLSVVAPTKRNATDSFLAVPDTLFTVRASDLKEDK